MLFKTNIMHFESNCTYNKIIYYSILRLRHCCWTYFFKTRSIILGPIHQKNISVLLLQPTLIILFIKQFKPNLGVNYFPAFWLLTIKVKFYDFIYEILWEFKNGQRLGTTYKRLLIIRKTSIGVIHIFK